VDRIGAGGMGILYLARDPVLERTVAIKVMSAQSQELVERFAREARSAAGLMHHNIVTIYDVGDDQGRPFIAMEYVDGETLAEAIRRKAPFGVSRKIDLMLELCSGLGYAHQTGIIHRDVKPANLMITSGGALKILDFGLARLAMDATMGGLTLTGAVLGTPHYMSPEQIEGHRVDHRSDIFAVGLVFYELLTYRKAYPGDSPHSVLHKILQTDPEPMVELRGGVAPELEQVMRRAIAKNADQRYQQLATLADDLTRIRSRLRTSADESTVHVERSDSSGARRDEHGPPKSARTPGAKQIPNLDAIARRRTAQIDGHLAQAQKDLEAGRLEAAIEECERAVLLDANHSGALTLLQRAHRGLEDRQIRAWLDEAETNLSHSALSAAAALIDKALALRPESPEAQHLHRTLQDRRREQERVRERARAARAALERARASLRDGALESAARSAAEALAHEPGNEEARTLKRQATDALEQRQRQLEHDQNAAATVAAARGHAAAGDYQRALRLLETFSPSHPLVDEAANEAAAEALEAENRRREDEQTGRRAIQAEKSRREARSRRQQENTRQQREAEALAREESRADDPHADLEIDRFEAGYEGESLELQAVSRHFPDTPSMASDLPSASVSRSSAVPTPGFGKAIRSARVYLVVASAAALIVLLVLGARALRTAPSTEDGTATEVSEPAPTPAPTPPPAAVALVPVTINAIPWAKVRIVPKDGGGRATEGTTPLVVDLQAGEYTLELRNDLFQSTSQNLTVGTGPQLVSVAMPGANIEALVTDVLGPPQ
jgi:eukaryotic-like serine/threonine-protein kinase